MNVTQYMRKGALGLVVLALAACGAPTQDTKKPRRTPQVDVDPANVFDPSGVARVALLVPAGSSQAQRNALAQTLVNAARMAIDDTRGAQIDLRVYETAGDPVRARAAATKALADGANIFLGPLFGVAAEVVGPIAAAKGVNVLTFSTTPSVAGRNVFLLGTTAETEADRAISFAKSRGTNSISIFYPNDASGLVSAQAIRSAARKYGVEIVSQASYERSQNGIPPSALAFSQQQVGEALVIPGRGRGLQLVGSFLSFYGVRQPQTKFIGLGQWNAPVTRQERTLQGGWFVAPDPSLFNSFAGRYQAKYGSSPPALAALAYDGIAAIGAMLKAARDGRNSEGLSAEAITDPGGFVGVNGVFRLRRDGRIDRKLAVMEVAQDGFRVVDPAPKGFGTPGS